MDSEGSQLYKCHKEAKITEGVSSQDNGYLQGKQEWLGVAAISAGLSLYSAWSL